MADEARLHFCVDRMRQQSYRKDLVDATGHPSAVSPDAEPEADALRARLSAPSTTKHRSHAFHAITASDFKSRALVSASRPHPRSSSWRAGLRSARSERTPSHHERLHRVRTSAHGVRRTGGSEAGAGFDRALS